MTEVEPQGTQHCDNCDHDYRYWLLFFPTLGISICEECLEGAIGTRNSLRWGLKSEA